MVRVFVIERRFHQTEGWDVAWTSPLECCAPQALVEKRPYIYMGGYDPKVIKNREKLHFFFRPLLFLLSTLANSALFPCKLRTASLRTCRHFPPFFRSKPPWYAHKNPLRMRCRGDYSSCFGADHLKDAHRHRSRRGGFAQNEGASAHSSSQNFGHFYIVSLQACQPFLTERSERKAHSPLVVLAHLPFDELESLGRSNHLGGIGVRESKGFCHLSSRLRGARTEGAKQHRLIEIQIIMLLEILLKIKDGTI